MMMEIALISLVFLLGSMLLSFVFIIRCRRLFDQVLVINLFATLAVGVICAIGLLLGNDFFVDIALLYTMINFVSTIALLRLFNRGNPTWLDFSRERDK